MPYDALSVEALNPLFGARIDDVDLKRDRSRAMAQALRDAVHRFGVIVLKKQSLSSEELGALGELMGEVHLAERTSVSDGRGVSYQGRGVYCFANLDENGSRLPPDDRSLIINIANELWHTDQTFMPRRAEYTFLMANVVPPEGGATEFCDTRVAFEMLSEEDRRLYGSMVAYHSRIHSRSLIGFNEWTDAERQTFQMIRRPLVQLHTASNRTALCVASHIARIEGFDDKESQAMINRLVEHSTKPGCVYAHKWDVGDLIIWDNRCTMHRARPFDGQSYIRSMSSLRTIDPEDQPAAA